MVIMKYFFILSVFLLLSEPLNAHAQEMDSRSGAAVIDRCWKEDGSHVAIVECEFKVLENVKQQMQTMYDAKIKSAHNSDEEMEKMGSSITGLEASLIQSQKAFEAYKESECQRKQDYVMGGTFGADATIGCEIDLIDQRIKQLQ